YQKKSDEQNRFTYSATSPNMVGEKGNEAPSLTFSKLRVANIKSLYKKIGLLKSDNKWSG
ncbi:hypothetical protein, partial [Anaerococcus tetradius]|uniref:hypothetical protein n=1 Tax=Anaerococcus tetradius TaxID=33036 RepID=UPI0023EF676D